MTDEQPQKISWLSQKSDWQMRCAGAVYRPLQDQEPNRFHRFMQRLVLGFRWERAK